MKPCKYLTFGLAIALVAAVGGAWLLADSAPAAAAPQEEHQKIRGSDKPPPEVAEQEKREKEAPKAVGRPASVDQLLEAVKKQRGGADKVEMAKAGKAGKKVAGSARKETPPGLEDRETREKEAPKAVGRPAKVDELLELVKKQPGGRGKVEAANKARGKGPGGGSGALAWLQELNPFRAGTALAQSGFSVDLNAGNNWRSTTPYGWAYFYGVGWNPLGSATYVPLYPRSWSQIGHQITNPYAYTGASVGADGWYVINLDCYYSAPAVSAWAYVAGTGWVKQADLPSGVAKDYPVLLYLGAGYHYLLFTVNSGYCYAQRVTWTGI